MIRLLDDVIIFQAGHFSTFRRFSVDLLNNFENFMSVIIIHFIFYGFLLLRFVDFVGGIILSLFKVLLRVFSDTILFTLFIRLYYIPHDG